MTVEEAGHMGGHKVKKLIEERKEYEKESKTTAFPMSQSAPPQLWLFRVAEAVHMNPPIFSL